MCVGAGRSHLPVRSVLLLRRGVHWTPAPVPAREFTVHLRASTETRPYKMTDLIINSPRQIIIYHNILLDINTVALEGKLDEKSIFANLYNDIDYNSNLKTLLKKIKHDKKDKQEDDIYRVLRGEFNYFSPKTNVNYFTQYPDMRRFDMIVAEALLISSFYSFNFSVNIEELKLILLMKILVMNKLEWLLSL